MKTRIIVFVAAGLLILTAGLLFMHAFTDPSASADRSSQPVALSEGEAETPRIAGTARVVPFVPEMIAEVAEPVILESVNPSIRSFKPAQIVEEKRVTLSENKMLRRRLVTVPGRYPNQLVEDTLRQNDAGAYEVVSQTAMVADHVLIKLASEKTEDDLQAFASTYGVTVVRQLKLPGYYVLKLKQPHLNAVRDALKTFSQAEPIEQVEPNYIGSLSVAPNDPEWSELWGMQQINAPIAWDTEIGSEDILVAVVDSGVDADHLDLRANIYENPGEAGALATNGVDDDFNGYIDDWRGWDFYNDDNDPSDDNSHGTHVAGTIGATGNNGIGVAGVCWAVSMLPVKIGGADGTIPIDVAIDGVLYAADMGARVQNHSWGWIGTASTPLEEAIQHANTNGSLFVAAAGNDNNDNDETATYPSGYDLENVISVAATDESDKLASFSSYGAESVDLAAPGVAILSTTPDDNYEEMQGTSMATPHVVGAAALLLSANPSLSHLDVKAAILNSVEKVPGLSGKVATGGRLDVAEMMTASLDGDGDGMPDSWEDENQTNSLGVVILDKNDPSDANDDPDDDHLINLEEYRNGTDPNDPDTDGDSLVDGWEVRYGFNPLTAAGPLEVIERNGIGTGGTAYDVFATNGYAYVAAGEAGLVIVDVSDPTDPKLAVASALSTGSGLFSREDTDGTAQGVAVQGDYAYIADGTNGLVVIDVSNPLSPSQVGGYDTDGDARAVAVSGNHAYLADGINGMVVVDISNATAPEFAGQKVTAPTELNDIHVSGNVVYVSRSNSSVAEYDVSDPTAPTHNDAEGFGGSDINVLGIHENATHIFAAVEDGTVRVVEKSPTLDQVAVYQTKETPLDVFVRDGFLYVAEGAGGLEVVDVSDPENPTYISHHPTYGGGYAVFADGDYVYMADGINGLQIFFIAVDVDSDGMLDSWEQNYFGLGNVTNTLPTADPDGDGIINWGEYLARLIPTNSDQDADGLIDGFDEVQIYNTDPRTPDTDNDGLTDYYEVTTNAAITNLYLTDPLVPDTDGDGMPDGWEVDNGLNPLVPDADDDDDGDDLTNYEEYQVGTDPLLPDTDGDGMPDGWEVDNELDPLVATGDDGANGDPDSDLLLNIQEYSLVSNSLWQMVYTNIPHTVSNFWFFTNSIPGSTDPRNPDTDGDLLSDYWEITTNAAVTNIVIGANTYSITNVYLTNPLDPDTDGDGLSDGWESTRTNSNPMVPALPTDDSDGDGLTNEEEEDLGTQLDNELDPIFVDDDAPFDVANGLPYDPEISDPLEDGTMIHPFDAIGEAVAIATDGMTVLVTNGWYAFTGNYEIDPQGKAITIRSWHGRDVTFINSMGIAPVFTFSSGEDTNTVIQGFSLTTSLCEGSDGDCNWVNGIEINNASPIIEACRIHECELDGIKITGGSYPIIRNNIIEEVLTGITCEGGATPLIVSNHIRNNWFYHTVADSPNADPDIITRTGCGIYADSSSGLVIQDSLIENCWGRGVYVRSDTNLTITGTVISNCLGGVRVDGGSLTMGQCMLQGNQAPNYYNFGDLLLKTAMLTPLGGEDVEDVVNDDENGGGLLLMDGADAFIQNVLAVQGRTWADDPEYDEGGERVPDYGLGAGLYVGESCELISVNCTVADNLANTRGGGTSCHDELTLRNIIAYGNRADNARIRGDFRFLEPVERFHNLHCRSGYTLVWHGDIEYEYFSDDNLFLFGIIITNDPGFVGGGNYHLATINSPCIDQGSPILAPLIDYDGVTRPFNAGKGWNTNAWHDFGAYEYSSDDYDNDGLSNADEIIHGTDPANPDSDYDGMPDGWEVTYKPPLNPTNSFDGALDSDSDGLLNSNEFFYGCNPTNADTDVDGLPDGWEIDNSLDPLDDGSTDVDNGADGNPDGDGLLNLQEYSLTSSSLWSAVWTNVSGSASSFSFGMPGSTDPQNDDSDGDGLSDFYEITTNAAITNDYFTNPMTNDTDGDGLLDGWEIEHGANPTNGVDVGDDSDGDGLTNEDEEDLGTDPANLNDPVFVDDDGDNDMFKGEPNDDPSQDGSFLNAFDSIQKAIDSTNTLSGVTVLVTNGLYQGAGNYKVNPGGKELKIRSWHGSTGTVIKTQGYGSAFIINSGETTNTLIQGFTIETFGDEAPEEGVVVDASSPILKDLTIHNCELEAVSCINGAAPQIIGCTFYDVPTGLSASGSGGVLLQESLVYNTSGRGVVIVNDDLAEITWSTISNCAGGITLNNSDAEIRQCTIRSNNALNYFTRDEGSVALPELLDLTNSLVEDVTSSDENGAGILLLGDSSPLLRNCLIVENTTWAEDPNYSETAGAPQFGLGAGIYIGSGCNPTGINCTVADNHANTRGGGVSSAGRPLFRNMIFWGNTSSNAAIIGATTRSNSLVSIYHNIHLMDEVVNIWYSDIEGGYSNAILSITNNPQFVGGDYQLASTSLCIDKGSFFLAPLVDLNGDLRTSLANYLTNSVPTNRIDMGCYEFGSSAATNPIALGSEVAEAEFLPMADTDGDGFTDGDEVALGTDRYDDGDYFSVTHQQSLIDGSVRIGFQTVDGALYTVQVAASLTSGVWFDTPGWTEVLGDGSFMVYEGTLSGAVRYYRVLVLTPQPE